jgi:FAD/FMN-containing dehydrogenase
LNSYSRPLAAPNPGNQTDWDKWNALIVNLGCLGVMYRITFECAPLVNVHILDFRTDMEALLNSDVSLRNLLQNNEYAEIFWVPYNKQCWIRSWNQVPLGTPLSFWFWLRQWFVARIVGPIVLASLALFPYVTRLLMWLLNLFLVEFDHRVPAPDAMQYQRFFMRVYDMGYAIPYDANAAKGFDLMRKAWFAVVDRLKALHHQAIYPQNLVLHARFGINGTALIAPSSGQTSTCYLEIVTHMNTPQHEEYFREVERDWLRFGGRPHWGKVAYARERIRDAYPAAAFTTFHNVRRGMDPDQVFLNDYLREVLRVEEP